MQDYTWEQLREVPADSLDIGDTYVIPIAGTVCRVAKDGTVHGYAIGHSEPLLQIDAVFTITARCGNTLTGRRHDGAILTGDIPAGATVLRVKR
jgi:hypothetical protein